MTEFELLDFDDEPEDPSEAQETAAVFPTSLPEDDVFMVSARERLVEHSKSLKYLPVPLWQELLSELQTLPAELTQKLSGEPCAIPHLSLEDGGQVLEALQPLLKKPGINRLVYPLYHGLAAEHFLNFYSA